MKKNDIAVGLAVNITNLEGNFVITEIKDDKATIYSIANGTEEVRPLDDIELAVNSTAHSINIISLDTIRESIQVTADDLANKILELEEKIRILRLREQKLIKTERQCVTYYKNK